MALGISQIFGTFWDKLIAASPIPLQGCANSWFVVFNYHCDTTAGQRSSWRRNVYEQSEGRCSADVCVGCCLFRPQNSWSRLYASLRKVFFLFFSPISGTRYFPLALSPRSCELSRRIIILDEKIESLSKEAFEFEVLNWHFASWTQDGVSHEN